MKNSIIINTLLKFYRIVMNYYNNSYFKMWLSSLDKFLVNTALNSRIINVFIRHDDTNLFTNSFFTKGINWILASFKNYNSNIKKWIISSFLIDFTKNTIMVVQNNPFNIIGLFGIGFFISNIIFNIFGSNINLKHMLVKLILLAIFILVSKIKVSLKSLLSTSTFYKLFRWTINYKF